MPQPSPFVRSLVDAKGLSGWMRSIATVSLAVGLAIGLAATAAADDWPQWLGPQRDAIWREQGIVETLDEQPRIKWEAEVGGGYAGAAIADGRVYLMDYQKSGGTLANNPGGRTQLQGQERVLCLDAASGETLWTHSYDRPYAISYAVGPRATPAVDGDRVYTLGAEGNLKCLSTDDGSVVWEKDLQAAYGVAAPIWGFAAHPLVDGDLVYTMVGGAGCGVVAWNKTTGEEAWKALDAKDAGYCPPQVIDYGGRRQLIAWTPTELASLDPATGEVFWTKPLQPDYGMSIAMPRLAGDRLFASGYSKNAVYKLADGQPAAEEQWNSPGMKSLYSSNCTPVIDEGLAYGCDIQSGTLRAIRLTDGSEVWSSYEPWKGERRRRHATAFITRIVGQDRFILWTDKGDLVLCTLDPKGYTELSRTHVLQPTQEAFGKLVLWTPPAYAGRTAFLRNDNKLVAVDLAE